MSPDVSILIVTYRCRDAARACLASLRDTVSLPHEIVVLDNASGDGTVEMVREEFPGVRLIASEENLGFALGCNRAAEEARGEYLLLLNPDTVVHEGAVGNLLAFARAHPEHGLYGGRTLDPDGSVNPGSCWGAPTLWSLFCFATLLTSAFKRTRLFDPESLGGWKRDTVREVDIVTGCLLLAPRSLWRELGGFDTRFFMYGEDADLSLRAAALGYRPAITPDAVVTHEIGVSSAAREDKLLLLFRGKATLLRKHWRGLRLRLGLGLLAAGLGLRSLLSRGGGGAPSPWTQVWRSRDDWLAGYPEPESPPSPQSAAAGEIGAAP
ncbi:MAG TPA: glycosyltransferase family 2 protein [Gaiellaceae bacterium]|nr:glycosyltransferase family 2 protein [Gaiellaceae bacterium]HXV96488.1 glycosyltransferase family 2 protein [Gaiellaceae bacterium]